MTNNQLTENSVNQLLNSVRLARDNAERADNRVDHSFYFALTIALEELQKRRKADSEPVAVVPEDVRQALKKMDDEIIAELDFEESACLAAMPQELQKSAGALNNFRSSENVQAENPTKWWDGLYGGIKGRGQHSEGNFIPDLGMSTEDIIDSNNKSHVSDAGNSPVIQDTWIPVSERMPEERMSVILWDAEIGEVTSGHYSHKMQTFYHCGDAIENEITHWMAVPAPQEVSHD